MSSLFKPGSLLLEKKAFTFRQWIFTIPIWSPIGKWRVASFVQTWVLFTQQYFLPCLVEICTVVLQKKIFKCRQYIFSFPLSSLLGKGRESSFEQIWIPFTQWCGLPSLVEIECVVLQRTILNFVNIFLLKRRGSSLEFPSSSP